MSNKKVTVLKDCDGTLYEFEAPQIMSEKEAEECRLWYYKELGSQYVVRIENVKEA